MRLPEIQKRLRELSKEIKRLSDQIARRPSSTRGPRVSARMTPALRAQIKAYAKAHPGLSQMQIAERFNVNSGRVSETLRGKRK
jgi:hypothetical protein